MIHTKLTVYFQPSMESPLVNLECFRQMSLVLQTSIRKWMWSHNCGVERSLIHFVHYKKKIETNSFQCNPWLPFDLNSSKQKVMVKKPHIWKKKKKKIQILVSSWAPLHAFSDLNSFKNILFLVHLLPFCVVTNVIINSTLGVSHAEWTMASHKNMCKTPCCQQCVGMWVAFALPGTHVFSSETLGWKSSLQLHSQNNSLLAFLPKRRHR